jgi:Na+-driven multidrug efflux pump
LVNYAAREYGDSAIAGLGIVGRFNWLIFSVLLGFAMAYMPVSGYNYGARRYTRVREAFRFALRSALAFMTLSGILLLAFASPIASALHSDPRVAEIGAMVMRAQALTLPLVGGGLLINMLFESLGRGIQATILSLGRQGVFLAVSILVLPPVFGLDGIVFAQPVADVMFFALAVPLSLSMLRELRALHDDPVPLAAELADANQ